MNSREFFKEIERRVLRRVYLLCGEEEYAKDRAIEALMALIDEGVRDFNVDLLDEPKADRLIETARTWPMISDLRIVIVRSGAFFGTAEAQAKAVMAFLPDIPKTVCLVFLHRGAVDGRKALYKAIAKQGAVVEFERYSENEAAHWASSFAKKRGVDFPLELARMLILMTGRFLSDVANETIKLCDYVGEKRLIEERDIAAIVRPKLEYSVFEMLELFLAGRTDKALLLLDDAISEDERSAPIQLIAFFSSRLRQMLRARSELEQGKSEKQIADILGGSAYAAKKSLEAARRFEKRRLEDALLLLAEVDQNVKTSREAGADALRRVLVTVFA